MAQITLPDNFNQNLTAEETVAVVIGSQSGINDRSAVCILWGMRPKQYAYRHRDLGWMVSSDPAEGYEPASPEEAARRDLYERMTKLADSVAKHAGYNSYYASTPESKCGRLIYLCAVKYAIMKLRGYGKPEKIRITKARPRVKKQPELVLQAVESL